jgi:Flp pilus assembly protein protease CpaA
MEFAMLRFVICLVGCTAATYYDLFNRRNVPTWLTYALVAIGALFTLASLNISIITQNFLIAIAIFVLGYLLYRAGQIGGADVLVFISIALLLPEAPAPLLSTTAPHLEFPFVFSVFILSGMLGVFGIFLKYVPATLYEFLRGEKIRISRAQAGLAVATLLLYTIFLYYLNSIVELPEVQLIIFLAVVVCATSLFTLKDYISEKHMIRMVGVDEIDEEDILAVEKMDQKVVSKYKLDKLLTPSEIDKLRKMGKKKKFPVYKEMPVFMPYVLIALLAALLFGDPLAYLYPLGIMP